MARRSTTTSSSSAPAAASCPARRGCDHLSLPGQEPSGVDALLDRAEEHGPPSASSSSRPGVTWSLPLYEIALMTQRRAVQRGLDVKIAIVTPESAPLAIFGPTASAAIADLLRGAGDRDDRELDACARSARTESG